MEENIAHLQQLKSEVVQRRSRQCFLSCETRSQLKHDMLLLEGGIDTLQKLSGAYRLVSHDEYKELMEMKAKFEQIESNFQAYLNTS